MKLKTNTVRSMLVGLVLVGSAMAGVGLNARYANAQTRGNDSGTQESRGHRRGFGGRHHGTPPTAAQMQEYMERRLAKMTEHLNLTPAQVAQVRAIFTEQAAQMRAAFANTALTREQRRAAMHQGREAIQARIQSVLTAEQRAAFDAFRARHHGGRGPGHGGPSGECEHHDDAAGADTGV